MSQGFSSKRVAFAGNGVRSLWQQGENTVLDNALLGAEFEGIPSGVKRVVITFKDVSFTGTDASGIVLGTGPVGYVTSGYIAGAFYINDGAGSTANTNIGNSSTRLQMHPGIANTASMNGVMTLTLTDKALNRWTYGFTGYDAGSTTRMLSGAGYVDLNGELTRLKYVTNADAFDAGSMNVMYDNPDPTVVADTRSGLVVQAVHSQDGEVATGTTVFPLDDTIPQNTEGVEVMTASITPTNASNKLRIDVVVNTAHSAAGAQISCGVWQDSTADALSACWGPKHAGTNIISQVSLTHWMTAGTIASTTFKVRAGSNSAGTLTFNGRSGARDYGGVSASSITVTEYKA